MKSQLKSQRTQLKSKTTTKSPRRSLTTRRLVIKSARKAKLAQPFQTSQSSPRFFSSSTTTLTPNELTELQKPVKLHFRKYAAVEQADKPPVVVMHGLLGHSNNWSPIASRPELRQNRDIYTIDLRNHGMSEKSPYIDYVAMANDVSAFIQEHSKTGVATVVGHSMGGKTACALSLLHPHNVAGTAVVDILPVDYPEDSMKEIRGILDALVQVDLTNGATRVKIEQQLQANGVADLAIRQWLMTNLAPVDKEDSVAKERGQTLQWKPAVKTLQKCYNNIRGFDLQSNPAPFNGPSHLILGGRSSFGNKDTALEIMHEILPECTLSVIENAGHWCHAEKPDEFSAQLLGFLNKNGL